MRKVECDQNDYPDQSTSSPSPCFRGSIKCSTAPARLQAPWSPKPLSALGVGDTAHVSPVSMLKNAFQFLKS